MASRTAFAFILCIGLAGCGLGGPEVIAESEFTVSILGGKSRNPISLAESHCAQYGRKAVEVSHRSISQNELTVLYVYDCVDKP